MTPARHRVLLSQAQFILALLQGEVDGIVVGADDPEELGFAKRLGAAAAIKNCAIQEHATRRHRRHNRWPVFYLVAVGIDGSLSIDELQSGLGL